MDKDKNIKKNLKLEDIEKRNIHTVPEGYFEQLSRVIQTKATESQVVKGQRTALNWKVALRYAIPAVFLISLSIYLFIQERSIENPSPDKLLAEVSTAEIIDYLADSDISTEDILENIDFSKVDFEFDQEVTDIVDEEALSEEEIDQLLYEYDHFTSGDTL